MPKSHVLGATKFPLLLGHVRRMNPPVDAAVGATLGFAPGAIASCMRQDVLVGPRPS